MKKKLISASLFFLPLLAASVCRGEVVDRVVAVVGNEIITLSDVKAYSGKKNPLDALIREKLLKVEMERLGVAVTDADINNAIQDVAARNRVSVEILRGELAKKGISFEQYKKDLGQQIRQMKFMSQVIFPRIKITDDEVNRKAGDKATEQARFQARMALLDERASGELEKYLEEVRGKTFVEIKK